jgi:cation transport ATPase
MKSVPVTTPDQVEYLYRFCKKHYVHYYDLQTELVDHLASAIEEKITADPKKDFFAALDEVYSGFGYSGFAKVVAERTKELARRHRKIRSRLFWSYFRWPKLAFTIVLTVFMYSLGKSLPGEIMTWVALVIFFVVMMLEFYAAVRISRLRKQMQKELLLTNGAYGNIFFGYIFLQGWTSKYLWGDATYTSISDVRLVLFIALITFSVVYILTYYEYGKALFQEAKELYPQAFKSVN